jgi:hypothetical protein
MDQNRNTFLSFFLYFFQTARVLKKIIFFAYVYSKYADYTAVQQIIQLLYGKINYISFVSILRLQIRILILPAEIFKCLRLRHTVCSVDILYRYIPIA